MLIRSNVPEETFFIELHNQYYFANPRHVKTDYLLGGIMWNIVFDEQRIRIKLLSKINKGDIVKANISFSDFKSSVSYTMEFDDNDSTYDIEWKNGSHSVQMEIYQEYCEKQLEGYDFSKPDDLSDACFNVEGHIFHVHSVILSTVSPYFKTLFYGNFLESDNLKKPISIEGISSFAMSSFLNCIYAYPSKFSINYSNIDVLLELSDFYDCANVKSHCENYLLSQYSQFISISQKKQYAEEYNLINLKGALDRNHQEHKNFYYSSTYN